MRAFPVRLLLVTSLFCATAFSQIKVSSVVDVTNDSLSQNETPLAVNPANPNNMITGGNDWNYNDGCNTTFDGGKSWTPALPNGFLPGVTKYTNDPAVPGTGAYDAGGDPAIAFGPYKGSYRAYYVCQAFNFTSPYQIAMLVNTSDDGGQTWKSQNLTQVTTWNGNGKSKGSNGQSQTMNRSMLIAIPQAPIMAAFMSLGCNSAATCTLP